MKKCILIILSLSVAAQAQPTIVPTTYLNTQEPVRMCDNYIRDTYGPGVTCWTQPSAGALVRVNMGSQDRCVYIFCDAPTHRLIVYSLNEGQNGRTPKDAKPYGRQLDVQKWVMEDSTATHLKLPDRAFDSTECFFSPIDVAVSSCGRHYNPETDYIYVLDQGNQRIVKLKYDIKDDTLIWQGAFGNNILKMPTAIDYADYGDTSYANDDIYVTDAGLSKILRFSTAGTLEESFGGWGPGLADIAYPSGIAVSTSPDFPKRIYVTDSHNHRVSRYYSDTNGPITPDLRQYIFPMTSYPLPLINSVDTDADGNVYVVDSFHHIGTILSPALEFISTFGGQGYEPGQFDYPSDIYIDGHEMQICELFADSSGIQSFTIIPGTPKREIGPLPSKFSLAQNYPNPFNSNTTIMFEIPEAANVEITIYDILGRRVTTLIDEKMSAGSHSRIWNGTNQAGQTISSGVYFYLLRSGDHSSAKKMLLLK